MGILIDAWPYLAAMVVAIAGAIGLRAAGKKEGRNEVLRQQEHDAAKLRNKAKEVANEMDSMGNDAVRTRASDWVRGKNGK